MTEWQQKLIKLHDESRIARTFGMKLTFDQEGRATCSLPYNPNLDHEMEGIHGGVMATLIDNAGWFTSAVRHEGVWVVTSEFKVHLLEPAAKIDLFATGKMVRPGKRADVVEMEVRDASGKLYAVGIGTFMVIPKVAFGQEK